MMSVSFSVSQYGLPGLPTSLDGASLLSPPFTLSADVIFSLAVLSLEERSLSLTIAEDVFVVVNGG